MEEGGRRVVLLVLVVLPVVAAAAGRAQPQLVVHLLTIENYAYYELRGRSTGRGRGRWQGAGGVCCPRFVINLFVKAKGRKR